MDIPVHQKLPETAAGDFCLRCNSAVKWWKIRVAPGLKVLKARYFRGIHQVSWTLICQIRSENDDMKKQAQKKHCPKTLEGRWGHKLWRSQLLMEFVPYLIFFPYPPPKKNLHPWLGCLNKNTIWPQQFFIWIHNPWKNSFKNEKEQTWTFLKPSFCRCFLPIQVTSVLQSYLNISEHLSWRFQDPIGLLPWKLTCPLKKDYFGREYIFQPLIFRGHVSFQRGNH